MSQIYGNKCAFFEADFSDDSTIFWLANWLYEKFNMHLLINHVGFLVGDYTL